MDDDHDFLNLVRIRDNESSDDTKDSDLEDTPSQIEDLITSVITDWACVAAGVPSPLSENSVETLRAALDQLDQTQVAPVASSASPTHAGKSARPLAQGQTSPPKRRCRMPGIKVIGTEHTTIGAPSTVEARELEPASSEDQGYIPEEAIIYLPGTRVQRERPQMNSLRPASLERRRPEADGRRLSWPMGRLPLEMYEHITSHLRREDVKNMRLTCREFEEHLAHFFRSLVVPFSPELYRFGPRSRRGSPDEQAEAESAMRRASPVQSSDLKMFAERGWGIRQFAIAFEFDEDMLARPLAELSQPKWKHTQAFYGTVAWPEITVMRYATIRELESTADKTQNMRRAFALLSNLDELGLSLENGFGWLNGPDMSDRARRAGGPTRIFQTRFLPSHTEQATSSLSTAFETTRSAISATQMLHQYVRVLSSLGECDERALNVVVHYMVSTPIGRTIHLDTPRKIREHVNLYLRTKGIHSPSNHDMKMWELAERRDAKLRDGQIFSGEPPSALLQAGLDAVARLRMIEEGFRFQEFWSTGQADAGQSLHRFDGFDISVGPREYQTFRDYSQNRIRNSPLKPGELTDLQLRLLKENEWAQQAFLNSFVLAVIDNRASMDQVRKLNLAKLPGSQLSLLDRNDFWSGLPNVEHVTVMVAPDWRAVPRAPAFALDKHESEAVLPSLSSERLGRLLVRQIVDRRNITSLRLGFVGGGEHAPGMWARNRHVLPAPVLPAKGHFGDVLLLPHVDSLTLVNCWMPAWALTRFALRMGQYSLATLRLESFSLIAFDGWAQPSTAIHHGWGGPGDPVVSAASPQLAPRIAINGVKYTDFLLPHLTDAGRNAFFMEGGQTLATRLTRPVAPEACLSQPSLPRTWAAVLRALMPRRPASGDAADDDNDDAGAGSPSDHGSASPDARTPPATEASAAAGISKPVPSALARIELESVGYVAAVWQGMPSTFNVYMGHDDGNLRDRRDFLRHNVTMTSRDAFLASIVPYYITEETTTLPTAYGLTMGWPESDPRRRWNLEDDQLEGGEGRYTGVVSSE